MRGGALDLSVDWFLPVGDRFALRILFEDGLCCIARAGHPRVVPGMPGSALQPEKCVALWQRGGNSPEIIDSLRQQRLGLGLTVDVGLSEFLEVPFAVMQTDLFGFIPQSMAGPALRRPVCENWGGAAVCRDCYLPRVARNPPH